MASTDPMDRRGMIAALAGGAALAAVPAAAEFRWNRPKETAGYRPTPNGDESCARCKLFIPPPPAAGAAATPCAPSASSSAPSGGCWVIGGDIAPTGWCRLWEPRP